MKRKTIFFLILLLSTMTFYGQKVSYTSLKNKLNSDLSDIERVACLNRLAEYFMESDSERAKDSTFYYINTAIQLSEKAHYTKGHVYSLISLSKVYYNKDNLSKARKVAQDALSFSKKKKLNNVQPLCYLQLGVVYENTDKELDFIEKALETGRKFSDRNTLAQILVEISVAYNNYDYYNKSLAAGEEALRIYSELNKRPPEMLYGNLADSYIALGVYDLGVKYGLLAIKVGEKNGSSNSDLYYYYNTVGGAYNYLRNYKLSEVYSRKALDYAIKESDTMAIYMGAYSILTDIYNQPGRAAESKKLIDEISEKYECDAIDCQLIRWQSYIHVYDKLEKKKLADKYCSEMIKFASANIVLLTPYELNSVYNSATIHYYMVKDYAKARYYLNETQKLSKKMGLAQANRDLYMTEFKLDSIDGNYLSAIKKYQTYIRVKDSLFDIVKSNQISHYQTEYESIKKDNNIQLLTKEGMLQKAIVEKERRTVIVVVLLLGLALGIVGFLYWRNRSRRKHNIQLQRKQELIEAKNNSLGKLITEKEWLLKEIHHRVKNNLQIVMSLLNSQSHFLKDKAALSAIKDSQQRVNSISLIHQKLYQSENVAAIGMVAYIHDLVSHLKDSFDAGNVIFDLKIDDIYFDVSQAVPIGLILNEAITNAMKYAFRENEKGKIEISLIHIRDNEYELTIRDNGVGLPEGFNISNSNSLGMTLINGLSEDLEGEFEIYNDGGTVIRTSFQKDCFLERNEDVS